MSRDFERGVIVDRTGPRRGPGDERWSTFSRCPEALARELRSINNRLEALEEEVAAYAAESVASRPDRAQQSGP